ncbi:MAG: hypothetical protein H6895_02270 [Defluviimonas sp.]|uniref:hypothetical protein n=1 Tax=Albidovulum sp. TaxID=1872424 RepID=UPI001D533536|nr:hypothetical protein [Paracoccaceae bacterium]MCC0062898.1 hypothetical protein [Defluviimonas sp.]
MTGPDLAPRRLAVVAATIAPAAIAPVIVAPVTVAPAEDPPQDHVASDAETEHGRDERHGEADRRAHAEIDAGAFDTCHQRPDETDQAFATGDVEHGYGFPPVSGRVSQGIEAER